MAAESRFREVVVGIMFFVGLCILFMFAIAIAGKQLGFGKATQHIVVQFRNVKGVQIGTPVNLNGNPIGKVVDMHNNIELGLVDLELSIDASVKLHIGARIEVQSSIFGFRTIEITDFPEEANLKKYLDLSKPLRGETVPDVFLQVSRISGTLDKLLHKAGNILDNVQIATKSLNTPDEGILGKLISNREFAAKVENIIAKVETTLSEFKQTAEELTKDLKLVRQGEGVVGMLLNDAAVAQDVRNAIKDINETTQKFSGIIADIEGISSKIEQEKGIVGWLVGNKQGKDDFAVIVQTLRESSPEIKKTINNIKSISRKIDVGQGTLGRLVNDDDLLIQIESTLDSAARAVEDLRETTPITTFASLLFQAFQ